MYARMIDFTGFYMLWAFNNQHTWEVNLISHCSRDYGLYTNVYSLTLVSTAEKEFSGNEPCEAGRRKRPS